MDNLKIPADLDHLEEAVGFVENHLGDAWPMKARMQVRLAVEEIFVNIASYAYKPGTGDAEILCQCTEEPDRLEVVICDEGYPFDPLSRGEADISEKALMERIGGLGIHLVIHVMDEVRYVYENGRNILTMIKLM